ncbi:MAG: hypothetical protein CMJ49_02530 [Planctomycetaceae bacterium]|nr:hypothetical protein [Planctomycetaceae bacterium]
MAYRGAVIGLGWMGLLYDLAPRMGTWHVDDVDRPTPELNIDRRFYFHSQHLKGMQGSSTSYCEAIHNRPDVDLIAAAERDVKRLAAFKKRYGVDAIYTDAVEMLEKERPEIVGIASNTKGRPDLVCAAVANGAKGIFTEKPIAYTLEECDRMLRACADAGVPMVTGAISVNHPSFAVAKDLMTNGTIGDIVSIETVSNRNVSQHQNWAYFMDSTPAWVIGFGDAPRRESGSAEFRGSGMLVTDTDQVVHFRKDGPAVRITGTEGEILHAAHYAPWELLKDVEPVDGAGKSRIPIPWPGVQLLPPYHNAVYGLADVIRCLDGELDEPKNSARSVAMAFEVELAMKMSAAQGGKRIDLPLSDRSLAMKYDWHR